jgi:hypothetical protein
MSEAGDGMADYVPGCRGDLEWRTSHNPGSAVGAVHVFAVLARPATMRRSLFTATALVVSSGGSVEVRDELCRVEADGVCKVKEFDDIDASFPAFDPGNVRLASIQTVSKRRLGQLRVLPRLRQQLAQLGVLAREERLRHAPSSNPALNTPKLIIGPKYADKLP